MSSRLWSSQSNPAAGARCQRVLTHPALGNRRRPNLSRIHSRYSAQAMETSAEFGARLRIWAILRHNGVSDRNERNTILNCGRILRATRSGSRLRRRNRQAVELRPPANPQYGVRPLLQPTVRCVGAPTDAWACQADIHIIARTCAAPSAARMVRGRRANCSNSPQPTTTPANSEATLDIHDTDDRPNSRCRRHQVGTTTLQHTPPATPLRSLRTGPVSGTVSQRSFADNSLDIYFN